MRYAATAPAAESLVFPVTTAYTCRQQVLKDWLSNDVPSSRTPIQSIVLPNYKPQYRYDTNPVTIPFTRYNSESSRSAIVSYPFSPYTYPLADIITSPSLPEPDRDIPAIRLNERPSHPPLDKVNIPLQLLTVEQNIPFRVTHFRQVGFQSFQHVFINHTRYYYCKNKYTDFLINIKYFPFPPS